jgi:hypothetical protein
VEMAVNIAEPEPQGAASFFEECFRYKGLFTIKKNKENFEGQNLRSNI